MNQRYGDRSTFAIELGKSGDVSPDLRTVDVYADGRWLTCDDNVVYLPQFMGSLKDDLDWAIAPVGDKRDTPPFPDRSPIENHREMLRLAIDENDLHLYHRFMDWGPTADNISMHLFRIGGTAHMRFSFWRESQHDSTELGPIYCARLSIDELRITLHCAAWRLMWDWCNDRKNCCG